MNIDDVERLNQLSDKAIHETATASEVKEFTRLLEEWNSESHQITIENYFTRGQTLS